MITKLTKLLIEQHEKDKENGTEYIKISKENFYRGLIKFLKEINYDKD